VADDTDIQSRGMFITDSTGEILVSNNKAFPEGKTVTTETYFVKGLAGTYNSDMAIIPGIDTPVVLIAVPILDAQKQSLGIVGRILNQAELQSLVTDVSGLGSSGDVTLLNQSQILLTKSRFGTQAVDLTQRVDDEGVRHAVKGDGTGEYIDE